MKPFEENGQQDSARKFVANRDGENQHERKSFNPNFTNENRATRPINSSDAVAKRIRKRVGESARINAETNDNNRMRSNDYQQREPRRGNYDGGGNYSDQRNYRDTGGGYNNRDSGGYNNRDTGGGYNNRDSGGGYNNRDSGYNNRGGYDNNGPSYRSNNYGQNTSGYNNYRPGGGGNYNNDRNSGPRWNNNNQDGGGYNNRGGRNNNNRGGSGNYRPGPGNKNNFRKQPGKGVGKPTWNKPMEYRSIVLDPNEPIRLNKFLANAGVCSRREADELIQAGVVSVNGQIVAELGTKILRGDRVMIHDQLVSPDKRIYIVLNKPKDCVTTSDDPFAKQTVMDLVKNACKERIYPVGRLDRNTTGVLLLTNDGDLAAKLTHPKYNKKKIYQITLDRALEQEDFNRLLQEGVTLDDGDIKADALNYIDEEDPKKIGIEVHSGRNRVVRRIFEHLNYRVIRLDRVYFAGLTKKNLRRGQWRFLSDREVNMLRMGAFE